MVYLAGWSGTASAHQGVTHRGNPVEFPVVLWVPVLTGLLGGIVAVQYRGHVWPDTHYHRVNAIFGVLFIALAGSFAITALFTDPVLGIGGALTGAFTMHIIAKQGKLHLWERGHREDMILGGVCVHRILEGVALGTLYSINAAIGVVGVAVIAGHTALETAVVGGMYSHRQLLAITVVVLVQGGYFVGAVAGVVGSVSVPTTVHIGLIGLLAGSLLMMGVAELT